MPDSRRAARLFGEKASGRSSLPKLDHDRGDKEYGSAGSCIHLPLTFACLDDLLLHPPPSID
jgi:hypothetical protein